MEEWARYPLLVVSSPTPLRMRTRPDTSAEHIGEGLARGTVADELEADGEWRRVLGNPDVYERGRDNPPSRSPREGWAAAQFLAPTEPALQDVLHRARDLWKGDTQGFRVVFSSLFLALLTGPGAYAKWLRDFGKERLRLDPVLEKLGLTQEQVAPLLTDSPPPVAGSTDGWQTTVSARELLGGALDLQKETKGAGALGVRHLIGAYLYRPPRGHDREYQALGADRREWSVAFLRRLQLLAPLELDGWKAAHRAAFGEEPPDVEGISTHIATDVWTDQDALGYEAYAHAIAGFITHPKTRPPFTISIQAPWGGGKTSLMRMIQRLLDPEAVPRVRAEAALPAADPADVRALTISDVLSEVNTWVKARTTPAPPPVQPAEGTRHLTVWFNAWKYETTNQVWAGLADAILTQVTARMSPVDREKFWLQLSLRRVDAGKIREAVHQRIFETWWRRVRGWAAGAAAVLAAALSTLAAGIVAGSGTATGGGGLLALLTTVAAGFFGAKKHRDAEKEVKDEPAAVTLSDYLSVPQYEKELGFVHHAEADLRRIFDVVETFEATGERRGPVVIFVDDLDRCSPQKVAQVMEAVNLFLAGDFPRCVFVLGMDTEMVAAALQAAHKDMIAQLPADAGIPVGWRFMDKFVQLPFLIPPAGSGFRKYTETLFIAHETAAAAAAAVTTIAAGGASADGGAEGGATEEAGSEGEHPGGETAAAAPEHPAPAGALERISRALDRFSDDNPELQELIQLAAPHFRENPREWKRFVNTFRFHYCLWLARGDGERPALPQLLRWTVLSVRWPEVVRWIRRSGGVDWKAPQKVEGAEGGATPAPSRTRLQALEETCGAAVDLASWQEGAKAALRLERAAAPWLDDDDLLEFFHREYNEIGAGDRLSDAVGRGFW